MEALLTWSPRWVKEPLSLLHYQKHKNHLPFLYRTIELATRGHALVEPNPRVGALLVHEDSILGEAYHQNYGGAHAERILYDSLLKRFSDLPWERTTLYVSLEPCSHYGKQPPCTDLILQKPPRQVVICDVDPNPMVCGQGIQKLESHGIGVLHLPLPEARWLNRHFYVNIKERRPYITLKWAQSRNSILGSSQKRILITDSYSQFFTHSLRAEHSAILIGANTLRIDSPRLTTRYAVGPSPVPIILAHHLPPENLIQRLQAFHSKIYILNQGVEKEAFPFIYVDIRGFSLDVLCQRLYEEYQIGSIFVEGGYQTLTYFLREGVVDEIYVLLHDTSISGDLEAPSIPFTPDFECVEVKRVTNETVMFHFVSRRVLDILNLQ